MSWIKNRGGRGREREDGRAPQPWRATTALPEREEVGGADGEEEGGGRAGGDRGEERWGEREWEGVGLDDGRMGPEGAQRGRGRRRRAWR